jgi:uncharacterized damage-inducible protein DinB
LSLTDQLIQEFEHEATTTRRVLERVPTDRLTWRPHPKSMSLGELALHVAAEPGALAPTALTGTIDFAKHVGVSQPTTTDEILAAHDEGVSTVTKVLRTLGDSGLQQPWTATFNGTPMTTVPRAAFVRRALLSHTYHHRGQLSVYLRLIDVPVPSIYGPSADENPFAVTAHA